MDDIVKSDKKYAPFLRQCFLTASVATNIVGHGCVIGFAALLIPSLRRPESHIHATNSEESWIASICGFALILGNFIITPLMDPMGRKTLHLLTTVPILIGWFMLLLADSVAGLITARFLQGIAMGMLGPLGSIIIGEMTDPKHRGPFLTSVSLSLTIGVLFTHGLGTYFSWQQIALICSFVTFISLMLIIYTPESPSWLIAKGRYEESRVIFMWLRGQNQEQEDELQNMIIGQKLARKNSYAEQKLSLGTKIKKWFRYFNESYRKPEFYKPIVIMFHLYTMYQFSGINVITSYTMDIIHKVVGPEANANFLMVALDVERLICSIAAVFFMRKVKRRTLLFTSTAICVLTYIGKGIYVHLKMNNSLPYDSQWIPITLIGVYMLCLSVGISPITFAVSGEIFPLEYRALGGGISVLALSLNFFVAVKSFPVLNSAVGLSASYYIYAAIVIYCLIVIWFMLPETKDRTLQEIEDSFRGLTLDQKSSEPLNGKQRRDLSMRRCSSQIIY